MKVFVYIRPKAKEFFYTVANAVFDNPEIISFSDFKNQADLWAGDFLYDEKYEVENEEFDKVAGDILPRCRTLRKLSKEQAYKQALRYWNGVEEIFKKNKIDYVIMLPVDCYTLDIIDRVARKYEARVISFIGTPFKGYAKITVRGEYNDVNRNVSEEEVNTLVRSITDVKFLPHTETKNVTKTHKYIYKFYWRRFLIEHFYYPLLKMINNDSWNYHYNIFEVKGTKFSEYYNKNFDSYFTKIGDLKIDKKKTVMYPLHLIPEATTDYWCPDVKVTDYNRFVYDMIEQADKDITIIIKEHPAMYGRRKLEFYEKIKSYPNVVLLHPMERSNVLLEQLETIVVDNGTIGIEALLRGKRVLALSDNYYNEFHPNSYRVDKITKHAMEYELKEYDNELFMNNLLKACFKSDFINSTKGIPNSNPYQVAEGIKMYLNK